jgi:hypothetical protein
MRDFTAVYDALEQRLREELGGDVKTFLRKNAPFNLVPSQPALLILETSIGPEWDGPSLAPVWVLGVDLTLYTQATVGNDKPGQQVLELIAKIHDALAWKPTEEFTGGYSTTLGGLVRYARISGDAVVQDVPPALTQQITEIPLEIVLEPTE